MGIRDDLGLGPDMPPAVSHLRRVCLQSVVTDGLTRKRGAAGLEPDHVHLARILFALTASTDAAVLAAIDAAIETAMRSDP